MLTLHLLNEVKIALHELSEELRAKIRGQLGFLVANETSALTIRTLRGKIKELKVKRYRLIFFIKNDTIYVIDLFEKKSAKTPHHILARAEKIYSQPV